MIVGSQRQALQARIETAMESAREISAGAAVLSRSSREHRAEAARLLRAGLRGRAASRPHRRYFLLEGVVGGTEVLAAMREGELIGDGTLIRQAQVVAALGETFEGPDGQPISASLEGPPIAVMLTLIRACDRPLAVELGPAGPPDLWGDRGPR